ncbi:hypothetical protein [Rhizobium leguminosarum]|uniref:hypothetical protein n=1 Tax=Rhizobium leguminosarum TaxID=384 RepID=UPI003F997825
MGWLSQKVGNWATKVQRVELEQFVARLKAMDSSEIGFLLAVATDRRHALNKMYGWDLLEPSLVEAGDTTAALKLGQLIKALQRDNNLPISAALMVWLHTLRSANNLDLRSLGRDMWGELSRGFGSIYDAAQSFGESGGKVLDLADFQVFPAGLTPKPL